jgi:hypothetical protein
MSADSNSDLESEVREIEKRLREAQEHIIGKLSKQLLDPTLSDSKRAQLEEHLSELKKRQKDDE